MEKKDTVALSLVSTIIALIVMVLLLADLFIEGNPFIYMVIGMSVFKMGVDGYRDNKTGVIFSGAIIGIQVLFLLLNYLG